MTFFVLGGSQELKSSRFSPTGSDKGVIFSTPCLTLNVWSASPVIARFVFEQSTRPRHIVFVAGRFVPTAGQDDAFYGQCEIYVFGCNTGHVDDGDNCGDVGKGVTTFEGIEIEVQYMLYAQYLHCEKKSRASCPTRTIQCSRDSCWSWHNMNMKTRPQDRLRVNTTC